MSRVSSSGQIFPVAILSCSRFADYLSLDIFGSYLAGVLFSVLKPVILTTTRTGFRRPVRTSSLTASVMVALKRPVRRCLGRVCRIPVILSLKPMSKSRSASSMINISRALKRHGKDGAVMISWRRPGVPIRIVGDVDFKDDMSELTDDVPPMRRLVEIREVSSLGNIFRSPFKTE